MTSNNGVRYPITPKFLLHTRLKEVTRLLVADHPVVLSAILKSATSFGKQHEHFERRASCAPGEQAGH